MTPAGSASLGSGSGKKALVDMAAVRQQSRLPRGCAVSVHPCMLGYFQNPTGQSPVQPGLSSQLALL